MAVIILHAPTDGGEAEALARACERRGVFLELETGARQGRPLRSEDTLIALLSPAEAEAPHAAARRRRGFDAALDARLLPAALPGALAPFGWRDLPAAGSDWAALAEALLRPAPRAEPAVTMAEAPLRGGRQALLIHTRAGRLEAADLAIALRRGGWAVDLAGADSSGARMRASLEACDAAAMLLNAEAGHSDGMRRWLYAIARERAPLLAADLDGLWRQLPLSEHLAGVRRIDLNRLPGDARGPALLKALQALPRRPRKRRKA